MIRDASVHLLGCLAVRLAGLAAVLSNGSSHATETIGAASPVVIRTGVGNATRDKPQSKLWYAHGSWWAWLPAPAGSAIWKRMPDGWQREESVSGSLAGLRGQADVWVDDDGVRAVLSGPHSLTLVALRYDLESDDYQLVSKHACSLKEEASPTDITETATLARDGVGRWWVAYDRALRIRVRCFRDEVASGWSEPVLLGEQIKPDDICTIIALSAKVGVVWTDQLHDGVYFAAHHDDHAPEKWQPIEVVEQGNRTADDHLNTAVHADGTLFVASKNSVDQIGSPQLVLRVRHPDGRWESHSYAELTPTLHPSRPIVLLGGKQSRLILLHTVYTARRVGRPSFIVSLTSDVERLDLHGEGREVLAAATALNNVTGSKQRLPDDAPWIVLASDAAGDVYEAELPRR